MPRFSLIPGSLFWLLAAAAACVAVPASAQSEAGRADAKAVAPAPRTSTQSPRQATYDFAFVSLGINQAWRLFGSKFYFGAGGGVGPALYRLSQMKCSGSSSSCDDSKTRSVGVDPSLEIAYANLFVRYAPIPYVDLDVGPKIAIGTTLHDIPDAPMANFVYGGYADLRVGSSTIKFGPRFEYSHTAYADYYMNGWKLTALMLRIVH